MFVSPNSLGENHCTRFLSEIINIRSYSSATTVEQYTIIQGPNRLDTIKGVQVQNIDLIYLQAY